jgi:hypothetical protein
MDGTGSESFPVAGFGVSDVETSGYTTLVLVADTVPRGLILLNHKMQHAKASAFTTFKLNFIGRKNVLVSFQKLLDGPGGKVLVGYSVILRRCMR